MVSLTDLWLPILASAAIVFVASSVIHMVLGYHRTDYGPVPTEAQVMEDLRKANLPPGDYVLPYAATPKEMGSPEYTERMTRGPIVFMTVAPPGPISMGRNLGLWFVYCVAVSFVAAYVAGRTLGPGAEYGEVFRFAGTAAFAGYVLALWQLPIWFFRSWSWALKTSFDGVIFALLTGGTFGWLWPA